MRNQLFFLKVNLFTCCTRCILLNIFQLQRFGQAKINELNIISDEDALCYLNNNPDLKVAFGENIEAAKKHWRNYGLREKRVKDCASLQELKISDEDVLCYLNNNPISNYE